MQSFAYASPTTLQEALGMLGTKWGEADVLAGGTDLLNLMKEYLHTPQRVVNIKSVKELQGIARPSGGLRLGALVTLDDLMNDRAMRTEYPALYEAARGVTSPQLRNMGTVGGDLCQRPRCWYFRQGLGLLGQDAKGQSMIPTGENRYHAIFPQGPAYFVSASSFGPALAALGAKVKLASASGNREVAADQFFVAPQNAQSREIALLPNEILTEIMLPASSRAMKNSTYEVRHRDAVDWPLATASVALQMDGKTVRAARVYMGHVGPTPVHAAKAEEFLKGKTINAQTAEQAGAAAVEGAKPLSENAYKVQLAKVAVKRALLQVAGLPV